MKLDSADATLRAWLLGVNEGRVDTVLSLYAEDAVLLATFSPLAMRTSAARRAYFEQLAKRRALQVMLHEKTLHTQRLPGGLEVISGIYCFRFELDAELFSFEARFSMAVNPSATQPLLHHHSSQIPRALS